MTGPEHYREAEKLLRDPYRTAESIAEAQVHATLALTAATTWGITKTNGMATIADAKANDWGQVTQS